MAVKIRRDHRSRSYVIDFSYLDADAVRRRFRRSAGKGVNRKDAERKGRALYRELQRNPLEFVERFAKPASKPAPVSFLALVERWTEEHVKARCRPGTQRSYEQSVRVHLLPYFGERDVRTITSARISTYLSSKAGSLAPKTVNNHRALLSSLFAFAKSMGVVETNPVEEVRPLKVPDQGYDFLSREESTLFLDTVQDVAPELYAFFLCALSSGMRLGELCGLRWTDVDLDRGLITVRHSLTNGVLGPTKSGKTRAVPMTAALKDVLSERRHADSLHVFCREDGTVLNRNRVKRRFWRALDAAGLRRVRLHDLRHSAASQLVAAGTPLPVVQQLLGHASITTTLLYSHLAPGALTQAVESLDFSTKLSIAS